ncbi:hypothetical protein NLI96_g6873 [Meripilus lineatus]|uniref:Uncharacterized protein n=1 Tax=Meripilus lineatus TaxID=2056292 RepID=A0AAD5YDG8_9APHY|nr:hypothetical protein NLI96_g6873 [Physisporinus lineatus]
MVTVISLYGGKHPSTIPLNPTSWTLFMAFRRLEDLGLWYLTINSMSDLIRVISSLPKLKSFLTTDIDWANSNTVGCPPPKRRQGKPRLSRLNLRAYKGNPSVVVSLMEWFAWSCDMDALTSLEIHIYTMHPCPTLATILQECQFPSLTDLDLEFVPGMLTQSFPDLRLQTVLPHPQSSFHIGGLDFMDIPVLINILSVVPAGINELVIYILVEDVTDDYHAQVELLDKALSKVVSRNCQVRCGVENREVDDFEYLSGKEFPSLSALGVLYK